MNVRKEAQKDAYEFARALMFYGEGAGTRRKLIRTSIDYKFSTIPGYAKAYQDAFHKQDMDAHVNAARKERHRKDVSKKVDRNVRGLISGNRASLTTGVAIVSVLVYVARETGYDKKIQAYAKTEYNKVKPRIKTKYNKTKRWVKVKRAEYKLKSE